MKSDHHLPLSRFYRLERIAPTLPALANLESEVARALDGLALPPELLRGRRVAITAGSRGVASVSAITRGVARWITDSGGQPFIIPAMGSHGGATAEGQRRVLKSYGVTAESVGAEVISAMETVSLGQTPEGYETFMDRAAWEAGAVVVVNRIKPHTGFSGRIESGLSKMLAVGLGKEDGARAFHRWARAEGFEKVLRAMALRALASGKILAGLGVIENEFHEVAALRATRPSELFAAEEEALALAKRLVPRLPFARVRMLIVDEMGKNISGTGMDSKVIGRGFEMPPGETPEIGLIYARDLTEESGGNALGVGLVDLIHRRLYDKIDLEKTYVNVRTSMNLIMGRVPMHAANDRQALDLALGSLGSPAPAEQRIAWIRNTLALNRFSVSEALAREAAGLPGWRVPPDSFDPAFDAHGDLVAAE